MNDWFSFEQSPWEMAAEKLRRGDTMDAVRLLTLLEGEEEDAVEAAFETLASMGIALDISGLPEDFGTGEAEKRLRLEKKLAKNALRPTDFPEGDPLGLYLEEMAGIPAFGDAALLAAEVAQTQDPDAQGRLVNLSLSRVVELAGEYTGRGVLLLDLIQEGSLGLWSGILAYDGGDFAQKRDWWIRQYMAQAVTLQARTAGVGRKMRAALEDYRAADRKLLTQLGRNPTLEEIAVAMQISAEDAQVYGEMLRTAQTLAKANAPEKEPEEADQAVEDTAYFQSRQRIADMLSNLTEQEANVVNLRFGLEGGLPCSPEETAAKLGMTAQEVVAMEAAALAKLRQST